MSIGNGWGMESKTRRRCGSALSARSKTARATVRTVFLALDRTAARKERGAAEKLQTRLLVQYNDIDMLQCSIVFGFLQFACKGIHILR